MKREKVDFLILGKGFSGTALAFWLEGLNKSYVILSHESIPCASRAAVGLVNPVTGRRLAKSWNVDYLFPMAKAFYHMAYQIVHPRAKPNDSYFEPMAIVKALHSVEETNFVSAKSAWPGYENLIHVVNKDLATWPSLFSNTCGWCEISSGGRLLVQPYLNESDDYFQKKGVLKKGEFKRENLRFENGYWVFEDLQATTVVSCLGLGCPWLRGELIPVKGQVLEVSGIDLPTNKVFKTEKFFLPLANGNTLCGSTYENEFESPDADEVGKKEILRDLKSAIREKIKIEQAWAGIRPTTPERQPIIKELEPGIFSLNGMGTKGVSLSPWAAWQLLGMIFPGRLPFSN